MVYSIYTLAKPQSNHFFFCLLTYRVFPSQLFIFIQFFVVLFFVFVGGPGLNSMVYGITNISTTCDSDLYELHVLHTTSYHQILSAYYNICFVRLGLGKVRSKALSISMDSL